MVRLIFFLLFSQVLWAQLYWLASGETGYYNSSGDFLESQSEILTRLNFKSGYIYKDEKNSGKIDFQLRPEIYGFYNKLNTTKIGIDGFYTHTGKETDWTISIAANEYIFTGDIVDFSYDSFVLNGQLVHFLEPKVSLGISGGIAYRNFDQNEAVTLDIIFFEIDYIYSKDRFTKISGGIYTEKFRLNKKSYDLWGPKNLKNNGTRIGPVFKFNYTQKFVFSSEYRFLLHNSEYTSYPSYDQWFRILTGKSLAKGISVFLLADYYSRNFEYENSDDITELLYTPVNFENRVFIKFSNAVRNNQKIFIKIGYFDEQLFYRNYSISGWKGYIGFEIRG